MDYLIVITFGLIVGSFLNAAIWRLHEGLSIVRDRSMCPHCRTHLAWRDLVPILSYLMLGGVCRSCGKPISYQYPLVEAATAALFLVFFIFDQGSPNSSLLIVRDWFFAAVAVFLFVYDLRWYELPDIITIPATVLVYVLTGLAFGSWGMSALALGAGAVFFLVQYVISRGTWVGGGDIRLGALMGALLGLEGLAIALFLAYMIGSLTGIVLILLKKKKMSSQIPFAPFLLLGTAVALIFRTQLHSLVTLLFS